jgi:hypothetical protein
MSLTRKEAKEITQKGQFLCTMETTLQTSDSTPWALADEILPGLYLGAADAAYNCTVTLSLGPCSVNLPPPSDALPWPVVVHTPSQALREKGVTHILCAAKGLKPPYPEVQVTVTSPWAFSSQPATTVLSPKGLCIQVCGAAG